MSKALYKHPELQINNPPMRITYNSGNNQRYIPEYMIHFAKKVMGKIDREPASCEIANKKLIKADKYFNKEKYWGNEKSYKSRVSTG